MLVVELTEVRVRAYSGHMETTYEIHNHETGEVVDTTTSYIDALGVASHLTKTTKVLHFVPQIKAERTLAFVTSLSTHTPTATTKSSTTTMPLLRSAFQRAHGWLLRTGTLLQRAA